MLLAEFYQGIEEFNSEEFYACHDTLESLWMEASEPHKTFYQGILQIAVSCYHLGNYNWQGAVILLGEGLKRLRDYQPSYEQVDVTGLMEQSLHLLQGLQEIQPEEIKDFVEKIALKSDKIADFPYKLPKITLIKQNF